MALKSLIFSTQLKSVYAEQTNDTASLMRLHRSVTMTEQKNQIEVAIGSITQSEQQHKVIDFIMR